MLINLNLNIYIFEKSGVHESKNTILSVKWGIFGHVLHIAGHTPANYASI